jgi:cation:H+ antiporter
LSLHALLLLAAGLALLAGGAELLVRAASRLASSLGVTPMFLGLTVVTVGTTMPELAIGVTAAWQGSGSLAVGNIAGTNLFNILFILGLSAALNPIALHKRDLRLNSPAIVAASGLMALLASDGALTRSDGGVLIAAAVLYTGLLLRVARAEPVAVRAEFRHLYAEHPPVKKTLRARILEALALAAGIALTLVGASFLVDGAVALARGMGISEAVIGLTIVAVGTSAPELATAVMATLRDERDVAVGNLIGSSVYNILVILGLTCAISPLPLAVERDLLLLDIPLLVAVAVLCAVVFFTGRRVSRGEGALFVALYLVYLAWLVLYRA